MPARFVSKFLGRTAALLACGALASSWAVTGAQAQRVATMPPSFQYPVPLNPMGSSFGLPLGLESDGTFQFLKTTNGVLQTTTTGSVTGTLNQGAAGTQAWPVAVAGGPPLNIGPITIATPGTASCFASQVLVNGITIVAQRQSAGVITTNTSAIEVGSSSVTTTNSPGIAPGASASYSAPGGNANTFCINGITAGDGAVAFAN